MRSEYGNKLDLKLAAVALSRPIVSIGAKGSHTIWTADKELDTLIRGRSQYKVAAMHPSSQEVLAFCKEHKNAIIIVHNGVDHYDGTEEAMSLRSRAK